MRRGRRADGVHRLHYAVQRRVRPDRHVGAAKVVVDGSHHADHVQVGARGALREDHYHHDVDHEIMIILYKRKGRGEGRETPLFFPPSSLLAFISQNQPCFMKIGLVEHN